MSAKQTESSSSSWQRARSDKQKEQRVQAILQATDVLFKQVGYASITMLMIAQKVGFTRSNLYRYFTCREEIFLALYEEDATRWIEQLQEALAKKEQDLSAEVFMDTWSNLLFRQNRLLELSPYLALFIRPQVTDEVFQAFEQRLEQQLLDLTTGFEEQVVHLPAETWAHFLATHFALIAGLVPMKLSLALEDAEESQTLVPVLRPELEPHYRSTMLAYLQGLMVQGEQAKHRRERNSRLHQISIGEND